MIKGIWLNFEKIIGEHTFSILMVQIVEKLFPLVSLWLVSISFSNTVFDSFGLVIISVSTIVAWSTSGIGVSATKSALRNGGIDLYKLGGLGRFMFIFTMIIYLFSEILNGDINLFSIFNICITGYYAALSVFRKSILIAWFKWRLLFRSFLLSLIVSLAYLVVASKIEFEYPEISIFLFYFLLSIQLKTPLKRQKVQFKEAINFFLKDIGPLYFTGIISGSVFYVLTQMAVFKDESVGITGSLAIGFQVVTILQFLPMAMNRIHFINIAGGKNVQSKYEVIKLVILTVLSSVIFFLVLPFIGGKYEGLGGVVYIFLSGSALFSILSTFYGNSIIVNDKVKVWTLITFVSSIVGVLTFYIDVGISVFEQVFVAIFVIYFIQFLLAVINNEKFRVFHI